MKKDVPIISWTFDEGRFWDLWMFVHILSGMLIASLNFFVGIPENILYSGGLIGLTLWEIFEKFFGIFS